MPPRLPSATHGRTPAAEGEQKSARAKFTRGVMPQVLSKHFVLGSGIPIPPGLRLNSKLMKRRAAGPSVVDLSFFCVPVFLASLTKKLVPPVTMRPRFAPANNPLGAPNLWRAWE